MSRRWKLNASQALLPPGWQIARDPATGKFYFYNTSTGVVQWEPPGISAAAGGDAVAAGDAFTHNPWHHTNPSQYDGDIDLSSDDLPAGLVPTNLCGKSANAYTLQTLKAKANYVLPSDVGTAVFIELSRKFERPYSYPASAPTAAPGRILRVGFSGCFWGPKTDHLNG